MQLGLIELIRYKKIVILGFGVEGQSTYRFLRKIFSAKEIVIADKNPDVSALPILQNDSNLRFYLGDSYLDAIQTADMVIKSPGISLKNIREVKQSKFTSHTELFFREFRNQIIGVTGTKGKSTTASLIHHLLVDSGQDAILVGNMGLPPFDFFESIQSGTCIVFELSSHQLEQISISPHISILLNIFQEHLDHYESYLAYQQAKMRIARFQKKGDVFIYHADNLLIHDRIKEFELKGIRMPYGDNQAFEKGCYLAGSSLMFQGINAEHICDISTIENLQGKHNLLNIMAAINAVGSLYDFNSDDLARALRSFKPLAHRMELVGTFKGVRYYNDSIATIPEASMAAIIALKDVDTLILGGVDRGIDYDNFMKFLLKSNISNILFLGAAGNRMLAIYTIFSQKISNNKQACRHFNDFDKTVLYAKKITAAGKICLLSPAAASYDLFKNFAERGEKFINLVKL